MQSQLKKPYGVYFLAVLFLLAPIGNLIISFANSGLSQWYEPSVFFAFLQSVSPLDWLWLSLLIVTGILLLRPQKASWSVAIGTLFLVLVINIYRTTRGEFLDTNAVKWQIFVSCAATLVVLAMSFYFRFPYLDRRMRWFIPAAQRYDLRTPVQIVAQDIFEGVTESVSISGARVRLQRDMGPQAQQLRYVDVIFPEIKSVKIKTQVVQYADNTLRLKFKELHGPELQYLKEWLKSENERCEFQPEKV